MCVLPVGCFSVVTESNFHEFNIYHEQLQIFTSFFQFFPTISSAFVKHTYTYSHTHIYTNTHTHTHTHARSIGPVRYTNKKRI